MSKYLIYMDVSGDIDEAYAKEKDLRFVPMEYSLGEITAAAKVLRSHCEKFLNDMDVLEIVGTGGDGSNSINISTLASYTFLYINIIKFITFRFVIHLHKNMLNITSSKCIDILLKSVKIIIINVFLH